MNDFLNILIKDISSIVDTLIKAQIVDNSFEWFGYVFNQEHIILNGFITFVGLYFIRTNK